MLEPKKKHIEFILIVVLRSENKHLVIEPKVVFVSVFLFFSQLTQYIFVFLRAEKFEI